MSIHHPKTLDVPSELEPQTFIEEVVLGALRTRRQAAEHFGGRVAIELIGGQSWTIDLGALTVSEGVAEDAGAVLTLDHEAFEALINRRVDANEIAPIVRGDAALLAPLALVLLP